MTYGQICMMQTTRIIRETGQVASNTPLYIHNHPHAPGSDHRILTMSD